MEVKAVRSTFTGSESKPVYGLPKKTTEKLESPRGSVRAMVQMYENRVRENSQEAERLSQRNSSVGRLSQDKLNIYERGFRDSSQEIERIPQRDSSIGRLTQDKLQPYLSPAIDTSEPTRNRSQTENQNKSNWLANLKSPPLGTISEDSDKIGSVHNKDSVKKYLEKQSEIEQDKKNTEKVKVNYPVKQAENFHDKKIAKKLDIKLQDLVLEKIDEKSEVYEKSVKEPLEDNQIVEEKGENYKDGIQKVESFEGIKEVNEDNTKENGETVEGKEKKREDNRKKVEVFEGIKSIDEANKKEDAEIKIQVDHKEDMREGEVGPVQIEEIVDKEVKKSKDKRRKRRHREKTNAENIENPPEDFQIVELNTKPLPDKQEEPIQPTNPEENQDNPKKDHKKSKRRSKRKEKPAFEASPESNEEYFISIHHDNKTEALPEKPSNDVQEFVIYPDYIENALEEHNKDPSHESQKSPEDTEKVSKIKKKRSKKVKTGDIEDSHQESQPDPFLMYIVPAPLPKSEEPAQSQKAPLPKAPSLPVKKTSYTPSADPPPAPTTSDDKPIPPITSKIFLPDSQVDLPHSVEPPPMAKKYSYNDFTYKKPENFIPIPAPSEEDSLKIVLLPTLPSEKINQKNESEKQNPFEVKIPSPPPSNPFSLNLSNLGRKESISELIQEIDVTCINCYECLRPEDIDSHSLKCLKPNLEITESMQADIRIKKMLKAVSIRKLESEGAKYQLYSRLEEYSVAILEKTMNSYSIYDKIEEIYSESLKVSGGLPILIMAKRLENLLEMKGEFSIQQDEKDVLRLYQEEAERQRRELEKWKMRSELLLQLAGNPASQGLDIDSDLGSGRGSVVSFATGFSDYPSDVGNLEDVEQVLQAISEEELEKHFYNICIRAKISLPKSHPHSSTPVSSLFSEVQNLNIPVSQWRDYINTKFLEAS